MTFLLEIETMDTTHGCGADLNGCPFCVMDIHFALGGSSLTFNDHGCGEVFSG